MFCLKLPLYENDFKKPYDLKDFCLYCNRITAVQFGKILLLGKGKIWILQPFQEYFT